MVLKMTQTSGLVSLLIVSLIGCSQSEVAEPRYQAEIVRTTYGIPHITADDYGSLGFGEAYAAAQDHVCNMAFALLSAKGETAKFLGAGHDNKNVHNDWVVKALDIPEQGPAALAEQSPVIQQWIEGYAAGYNHYLTQAAGQYDSWCDNEPWVYPVSASDFMGQYIALVQTLPRMAAAIASAQPPGQVASYKASKPARIAALDALRLEGMGSNGWAFGSEATENGKGALLANPHYPWYGTSRFWEKHLSIPGELNVYGAGLIGTPGVAIGFNDAVAWTHTVSDSKRVTLYQLTLNPSDPTQYLYEGEWRSMTKTPVTIQILGDSGIENTTTEVWFSHHGAIVNLPQLGWSESVAYAAKDANANNTKVLAQWLAMGQAQSMDEFIQAHKVYNAMPWVNTISTSSDGRAVYLDNSNVGALSDASIAAWRERLAATPQLTQAYLGKGLVILDGSTARDEWITDNGAPVTGTTPFDQRPLIESPNYVFNSNDSYWLSDPKQPTTGFSPLYGPVMTPRSIRTRMNIHLLEGIPPFDFRGTDGKFSVAEIQSALFDNSGLTAHLLKPALIERCQSTPEVSIDGQAVNLSAACAVLASWDNRYDIQSRGAVLFREWLTHYDYHATQFAGELFSQNFDPAKPALTPLGLSESDKVLQALGQAVLRLTANGIDLDEMLGELQLGHRSQRAIAIHGGNRYEGIANLQVVADFNDSPIFSGSNQLVPGSRYLTESGYNIAHGSSFIMALSYGEDGPTANAIMSYSQSGSPTSPHFTDQTELYRDELWRPVLYQPKDIAAGSISRLLVQGD